ncbi:hypothetical protein C8R43DRAFT_1063127 [Mycena crocata]|nr:hypothetical protein C8R43DRAFT_1063127 [Mycena crocata]
MKGTGGIFTEQSREMVRDMVTLNVAAVNVDRVIHTVARGIGVNIQDHISARHVGRLVEEGGIASDIQVAAEIRESKAVTISGDGTKIRHIDYEAKHVTFRDSVTGKPVTRMLDITSAPNHTSEAQLAGWQAVLQEGLVDTYNASPLGQLDPIDKDEFITFIRALGTDHAADQKKLARLCELWILTSRKILLGKKYMSSADLQSYLPEILRRNDEKVQAAGGIDAWNALSEQEKTRLDQAVCRDLYTHFGESEWKDLSPEARAEAEALVWCGCCMHKEMNSVKGGVQGMKLFWESIGGPVPVKLMNKGNDAAVSNSAPGSKAAEHALDVSEGGAVKLTSLTGSLLNHKDDKKGQQDTFKLYFEDFLGYTVSCPDTSNVRFQSHCDCAIFIILYLPHLLAFMTHIMYSKGSIGLNHLEANILKGLKCISTLTELAVLALYALSVSFAYMRIVRGTGTRLVNALDLGPLHAKVVTFCESVADNPDLLLAPDASYTTGTLDGQPWEHPDAFYAIQRMISGLPNISGCLKAFMTGAADTWKRFGEEYRTDGVIARLSAAARAAIYVNPTNDRNEGRLGCLRSALRHIARLSLTMHNARSKYSVNGTREFLRSQIVTQAFRVWLRAEARRRINAGRDRKRREELIKHEKVVVEQKIANEAERKRVAAERKAEIEGLTPHLDIPWIKANHTKLNATEIVKQINWHRQFVDVDAIPKRTLIGKMSKADKVTQLIIAVTRFNRDLLPKLELLAQAALTAGDLPAESEAALNAIPMVESWNAQEDLDDEDMLD